MKAVPATTALAVLAFPVTALAVLAFPIAAMAADAAHPFVNIDRSVDAGNSTGNFQTERLNQEQLDAAGVPYAPPVSQPPPYVQVQPAAPAYPVPAYPVQAYAVVPYAYAPPVYAATPYAYPQPYYYPGPYYPQPYYRPY